MDIGISLPTMCRGYSRASTEGRVTLAVGVGGREHDYRSLGAAFDSRHQRLDDHVATLTAFDADAVNRAIDGAEAAGLDEFVLVPASPEVAVLEATMELVSAR